MKHPSNIEAVGKLNPDYMGFILYKGSPRYVSAEEVRKLAADIPSAIRKVGVLVNEPINNALEIANSGIFDIIQLHGTESVDYCQKISSCIGIFKTFSISKTLPLNLGDYQEFCEMFLFDTSGKNYGGTGEMFDHKILSDYKLDKEFILSGGISVVDLSYYKSINYNCIAGLDLNSRFELKPGLKDVELLKKFINNIRANEVND